jgi:hypothetical protein
MPQAKIRPERDPDSTAHISLRLKESLRQQLVLAARESDRNLTQEIHHRLRVSLRDGAAA